MTRVVAVFYNWIPGSYMLGAEDVRLDGRSSRAESNST